MKLALRIGEFVHAFPDVTVVAFELVDLVVRAAFAFGERIGGWLEGFVLGHFVFELFALGWGVFLVSGFLHAADEAWNSNVIVSTIVFIYN